MVLTGNAQKDFELYSEKNLNEEVGYSACYVECCIEQTILDIQEKLPLSMQNSFIIEWLDTVGIYVEISGINHNRTRPIFNYNIQEDGTLNGINGHDFESRQKATEAAIKEANEIYNQKHK